MLAGWLLAVPAAAQGDVRVARFYGDCQAAVSYTFDDGLLEHYTLVFPELKKRGIKATFGIIGSKVGRDMKGTPCMSWKQLREMAADGQEITNHGYAHQSMLRLQGEALRYEVQHNDTLISDSAGTFPRTYIYPGNRFTAAAHAFCMHGRVGTRTAQVSIGSKRDSAWLHRWLDTLLATGAWGVGMTHGITAGYDALGNPSRLWRHLDDVVALRGRLWVATLCDVAAYTAGRDAVSLRIRRSKGRITVVPSTRLNRRLFTHPLTLVVATAVPVLAEQNGRPLAVTLKEGAAIFDFDPYGGPIRIILKNT